MTVELFAYVFRYLLVVFLRLHGNENTWHLPEKLIPIFHLKKLVQISVLKVNVNMQEDTEVPMSCESCVI